MDDIRSATTKAMAAIAAVGEARRRLRFVARFLTVIMPVG
jgi:hypothetical protein